MAETYYDSELTGKQLDEAFGKLANLEKSVMQADSSARTAQQYGQIVEQNAQAIEDIEANLSAIKAAPANAQAAANSATAAASSANAAGQSKQSAAASAESAKNYAEQAQQVAQGALGWYATDASLKSAHPTGQNGQWAIIGTTDTIWTWDSDTNTWKNTSVKTDLSNYYTKSQTDSKYAPKNHASSAATYGLATGSVYGHVKLSDTAGSSGVSGGIAATPLGVKNAISAAAPDFTWHTVSGSVQNCSTQYSFARAVYNTGARLMYVTIGVLGATSDRNVLVATVPLPSGYSLAVSSSEIGALTKTGDNTVANNQAAGFEVKQSGSTIQFLATSTDKGGWAKAAIMLPISPAT